MRFHAVQRLAVLLSLAMLATLVPLQAMAAPAPPEIHYTELETSGKGILDGSTVEGPIRVRLQNDSRISRAAFHLNGASSPFRVDSTSVFSAALDTRQLVDGSHKLTVISDTRTKKITTTARFTVRNTVIAPTPEPTPNHGYSLMGRYAGSDSEVFALDGAKVDEPTRVIVRPTTDVARADFWLDDVAAPFGTATSAPFMQWLDNTKLVDGVHRVRVRVQLVNGMQHDLLAAITTSGGLTAPAPSPDPAPQPDEHPVESPTAPVVTTASGLHVTGAELAEWRNRVQRGVYVSKGDVSQNSPGDWSRISANAAAFMSAPAAARWNGPVANNPGGCVTRDGGGNANDLRYQPPVQGADNLRDAAFRALVTDDAAMAQAVKRELLTQAGLAGVDFSDSKRWCTGQILDGSPGFMIATWATKLLFAADYLRARDASAFSAAEWNQLMSWFTAGARWMAVDTDIKLDELFVDRPAGNYTLTPLALKDTSGDRALYAGGPEAKVIHRRFNNRNARQARFVTLVGVITGNEAFTSHGKRYVQDSLAYAYFPSGAVGDFERWTDASTVKGWKYGAEFVGALVSIADHLARAGDASLYQYSTRAGARGTEGRHHTGVDKSLRTLVSDILGYADGTYDRYAGPVSVIGKSAYRIDTVDERAGDERVNDTFMAVANRWYQEDRMERVYLRTAAGTVGYPGQVGQGSGDPWSGEAGIYPGALFMFGGMNEVNRPYPTS